MGEVAFVFSGQGAQFPGMGKALYESSAAARQVSDALEQIRPGTLAMCFEGSEEDLKRTENTQPCMYLTEIAAAEALKAAGTKRVIPLKVSGPFHSKMLTGAGEKLGEVLKDVVLQEVEVPYTTNVTAQYVKNKEEIKDLLVAQVSSSVRWQQCVETMIADGVDTFVEIGPGKTLSGFMRKINRNVKVINIQTVEDFEKAVEELQQEM